MKKAGTVFVCLLPTAAAFLGQIVMSVTVSGVYTLFMTFQGMRLGITNEEELTNYAMEQIMNPNYLLVATAFATFYTLLIGFFWYHTVKPKEELSFKQVVNGKLLVTMGLLGIALQLLVSMCLNVVFPILPQQMTTEYGELIETLIGGNVWLSLLVTVILAPLAEELIFRGATLKMAKQIMPFMAANILQAVLFGIYHANLIQGVYAFVLGLVLGFTAEYFHSIWASILLHAFVNGSAELLNLLPEQVTGTWIGLSILSVLGVVLLFVSAKLYPKAKKFSENSFDE